MSFDPSLLNIEQRLHKHLMSFGFMPFLYLIDKFEKQNDFEKCKLLYDTLNKYSKKYGLELPTKYDDNAILFFRKSFAEFGMTGETALANTPYYAIRIECDLNVFTI